jgi:hypothetical protein
VRQSLSRSRTRCDSCRAIGKPSSCTEPAIALVSGILRTDSSSLESLAAAEHARRDLARAMEQAKRTLAAYRRVMMTPPGATLV